MVMNEKELPGTILRLPAVYGPGDKQNRIRAYLDQMNAGPRLLMTKEQAAWRWTRGYVEDVAAAIALAVIDDSAAERVYNVGDEVAPTEREWVEEIAKVIDWTGEVLQTSVEDLPRDRRQPFDFRYELMTDTTRIREELGYSEPVGRQEALRRTVEWERAGGGRKGGCETVGSAGRA